MTQVDRSPAHYSHLLVVDLEATCWESNEGRVHEMETIEFGAVLLRTAPLSTVDEFSIYIRPRVHPQLSAFCTKLTGITQATVDAGIRFEELGELLRVRLGDLKSNLAWASWGEYDRRQLEQDANRWAVPSPLEGIPHFNLKKLFAKNRRIKGSRPGVSRALSLVGLTFEGRPHSGADDARNIARLLPFAIGD